MPYDRTGTLTVKAVTAGGALPLPNANVRITGAAEENADILISRLTDINGLAERVTLPAPESYLSKTPYPTSIAYGLYDISVAADGFYPKKFKGTAVFDGEDTFLTVAMIPRARHTSNEEYPYGNLNIDTGNGGSL